jgi:hypothetical protein
MRDLDGLFSALGRSRFRASFALSPRDAQYLADKGLPTVMEHARAFVAQQATACCCRGCLAKWHRIPAGRELTHEAQAHVLDTLERWLAGRYAAGRRSP